MTKTEELSKQSVLEPSMSVPSPSSACQIDVEFFKRELEKAQCDMFWHTIGNLEKKELTRQLESSPEMWKKEPEEYYSESFELGEVKRQLKSSLDIQDTSQNTTLPYLSGLAKRSPFLYPFKLPRSNLQPVGFPHFFHSKSQEENNIHQLKLNEQNYKTVLCHSWTKFGMCKYGWRCRYAHGKNELRLRVRVNPRKSKSRCNNYLKGNCRYGSRCRFVHAPKDKQEATTNQHTIKVTKEAKTHLSRQDRDMIQQRHVEPRPLHQNTKTNDS